MCRASTYKRVLKLGTDSNFQSRDLTTIICCVITSYTHYICAIKHSIYLELLRVEKNYQSTNSTLQKRKV